MVRPHCSSLGKVVLVGLLAAAAGCSASGGSSKTDHEPGSQQGSNPGPGETPGPVLGGTEEMPVLEEVPEAKPETCEAVLNLTIRDFQPSHPDFESYQGLNDIGCGMVSPTLAAPRP